METHAASAATAPRAPRSSAIGDAVAPLFAALLAVLSAAITVYVVTPAYVIDDAFIGFRYARNLFEGNGLVFNPGEHVEGYTSFLWVLMSWVGIAMHLDAISFMQGISVVAQVITVWFTWRIGVRSGRTPMQALVAPLFLATHVTFLTYPMTGMDATFIAMLVTLAVYVLQGGIDRGRDAMKLGALMVLIALTRFDGFVMVGILGVFMLVGDRKLKPVLQVGGMVVVALGLYHLWRFSFYPHLVPNTFYAKVVFGIERVVGGVAYWAKFLSHGNQFLLLLGLVPFALGRPNRGVWLCGWTVAMHALYVVSVGGDWMPHFRFILPVLPLGVLLMQEGLFTLSALARDNLRFKVNKLCWAVVLLTVFGLNLTLFYEGMFRGFRPTLKNLTDQWANQFRGGVFDPEETNWIGRRVDAVIPPDWFLAMEWAGVIPYYCHQRVLDVLALNDGDATQHPFPTSTIGMHISAEYLASRKPHLVVALGRYFDSPAKAIAAAEERIFRNQDPWVNNTYGGIVRDYGYKLVALDVGEGRYWPVLLRGDVEPPARGG